MRPEDFVVTVSYEVVCVVDNTILLMIEVGDSQPVFELIEVES
jgi:hypothetical protein